LPRCSITSRKSRIREIESYRNDAGGDVEKVKTIGKEQVELRNYSVSRQVDWYAAERSYPVALRFPQLTTIAIVGSRILGPTILAGNSRTATATAMLTSTRCPVIGHWPITLSIASLIETC
jgi:hypothetical protein